MAPDTADDAGPGLPGEVRPSRRLRRTPGLAQAAHGLGDRRGGGRMVLRPLCGRPDRRKLAGQPEHDHEQRLGRARRCPSECSDGSIGIGGVSPTRC